MTRSREEVERRVRELGWWYQHFELPPGVWTGDGTPPAYFPQERWNLFAEHVPASLAGKTVLDVGGNSGYFSIQMLLRGAERCTLVDPFAEWTDQARFAAEQFGVELEVVNEDIHVFCLTTDERFDYVLFLGTFYHLKYPVLVLDRLAEMTAERMIFQSHARTPEAGTELPTMAFVEGDYLGDHSNFWVPTHEALEALSRSAGLEVVARPHPEVLVCEPRDSLGKAQYRKELVFPRWGKRGHEIFPGPQRADAELLRSLSAPE
jgi:tRNA (mo5U34)-methyltransferase